MDRLFIIKFFAMTVPINGQEKSVFFDDEIKACAVFDKHAALLAQKPNEQMEILVFDDIIGHHCIRPDFFPYAFMYERGPSDVVWKEIDEKVKASERAVGINKDMGFKNEPETK